MRFTVDGTSEIINACNKVSPERVTGVIKLNMVEIYNRGKRTGGTPVDTGELRQSLGISSRDGTWDVGYTKDYAPDVEYGHRTLGGGFVQGQHFLQNNVARQKPQLQRDLRDILKAGG